MRNLNTKLLSVIALLITLVMLFTSCSELDSLVGGDLGSIIGGTTNPDDNTPDDGTGNGNTDKPKPDDGSTDLTHKCESVCNVCDKCTDAACGEDACKDKCEGHEVSTPETGVIDAPKTGVAYKFGMVQGNLQNKVYYLAGGMAQTYYLATTEDVNAALDVYLEETDGGYHLYCMIGGAKTYINFVVSGTHVNGEYAASATTVYRFDTEHKTLIAKVNGEDYWFATRNDNTYTSMGPCKVSYAGFYGQFYAQGGAGENPGGNTGSGDQGGTGENPGGNTGSGQPDSNPFENGFALGLVPAYNSSFGGYYIINNHTPYFTAEDIANAKAGCYEYYHQRDDLGRAVMAMACVCKNTLPTDTRGNISSVKPTGWDQNNRYSSVPGESLYNRSHLIAWSLTDEDANWENLVTGTQYMNQTVMTYYENQVLSYVKNSSSHKVLYRVTPIYNGNNLVCTGILLEAYSLNDNGEDISFCVFLYNIQPGIYIDYSTGYNKIGDVAGANSGLGTGDNTGSGNQGGNTGSGDQGGNNGGSTEDTDIPNNTITNNQLKITVDTLGIPSQSYVAGKAMFSGVMLEFVQMGNYGNGLQMRDSDKGTSILWNSTALPGNIEKIVLVFSSNKSTYDNADAVIFSFGNTAESLNSTVKLSASASTKTYTITPDGDFTFFKIEHDIQYSYYWDSITIYLEDGTVINPDDNQGGNTGSGEQGGNTGSGDQGGNTGSGSTDEAEYTFVLNTSSKKIHCTDCDSVSKISDKNKKEWSGSYEELQALVSSGYTACGNCKPDLD